MKGNCTKLERWNGTEFELIKGRVSISGPGRSRETVEKELTLDCNPGGGSETKKKSPGTKEIGDTEIELLWNPNVPTGTQQMITATGAGTVTVAGNAAVTITSAILPTSPLVLAVPVPTGTPAVWMAAVREYLAEHEVISGLFTVGGSVAALTLETIDALANDGTFNIALATGTATGITTAATSTATTAGVAGVSNEHNHHLFAEDFEAETATFWRIRHPNSAETGIVVHATVKELGEPEYTPNTDVKVTHVLEATGEYFKEQSDITSLVLPTDVPAPEDNWGRD